MRDFGFYVAIAFGVGLSVLVATPLMKANIEGGDWLQFAGALIGVGVAVFGALTVEHEKERRRSRRNMVRLIAAIDKIEEARAFFSYHEPFKSPEDAAMQLRHRAIILRRAMGAIEHVIARVDIEDVDLWAEINRITEGFPDLRKVLDQSIAYDWGRKADAHVSTERIKLIYQFLTVVAFGLAKAKEIAGRYT